MGTRRRQLLPGEAVRDSRGASKTVTGASRVKQFVHGVRAAASGALVPENLNWGVSYS